MRSGPGKGLPPPPLLAGVRSRLLWPLLRKRLAAAKPNISSKTKGAGENKGPPGYRPKILLLKRAKMVSVPSIGVIGKSALEIGQFLNGGPFLSRPLWLAADNMGDVRFIACRCSGVRKRVFFKKGGFGGCSPTT